MKYKISGKRFNNHQNLMSTSYLKISSSYFCTSPWTPLLKLAKSESLANSLVCTIELSECHNITIGESDDDSLATRFSIVSIIGPPHCGSQDVRKCVYTRKQ